MESRASRTRILGTVLLAALPLVALAVAAFWRQSVAAGAALREDRVELARAMALTADAFVDGNLAALRAVALHPQLAAQGDAAQVAAVLRRAHAGNPNWDSLGLIDAEGWNVAGTDATLAPRAVNIGDRAHVRQALDAGRPAVSVGLISRSGGQPVMALAAPVELPGGGRWALVASLALGRLEAELRAVSRDAAVETIVLDGAGQMVLHPDWSVSRALTSRRGRADAEAVLAGETGVRQVRESGLGALLVAYAPVPATGGGVLIRQPARAALDVAYSQLALGLGATLLALGATAAVAWVVGSRLARSYTQLAAAQAEQARLYRRAEEALRQRDDFLAAAAHDLQSPLAAISGTAQLLQRWLARGTPLDEGRVSAALGALQRSGSRAAVLVAELLDASRLQAGQGLELVRRPADLVAITRQAVAGQAVASPDHRLTFEADDSALVGQWDVARLERVLANLLDNAAKYSPEGSEIVVTVGPASDGDAVVTVRDHGIGIPAADVSRVFERFHRAGNVAGRIRGTGLGLAGARAVVEQQGGTVEVESEEGRGTTVSVRLPLTPPEALAVPGAAAATGGAGDGPLVAPHAASSSPVGAGALAAGRSA